MAERDRTRRIAKTADLKTQLLKEYGSSFWNVSVACRKVGVSRSVFNEFKEKDPGFRDALEELEEAKLDWVELHLFSLINDGNQRAIRFYLSMDCSRRKSVRESGERLLESPRVPETEPPSKEEIQAIIDKLRRNSENLEKQTQLDD
ncbi:hypothetical protein N8787_02940 [Opitutaceae bacterium]|nr:hypothetical protein [Opitutaceae bacterium]